VNPTLIPECGNPNHIFLAAEQDVARRTCCTMLLRSDWQNDSLLQQILGDDSIYDVVQNKFSSDHLFDKYLIDNLKMNIPVACQAAANTDVLTNGGCLTTNVVDAGPGLGASLTEVKISKDAALEYHYVPILVAISLTWRQTSDDCSTIISSRSSSSS